MKKYLIMLVMLFTMSVNMFAEDNNATEIERIERYNVKVNTIKLADEYYTDLYGYFSKLYQIVKFKLKGK